MLAEKSSSARNSTPCRTETRGPWCRHRPALHIQVARHHDTHGTDTANACRAPTDTRGAANRSCARARWRSGAGPSVRCSSTQRGLQSMMSAGAQELSSSSVGSTICRGVSAASDPPHQRAPLLLKEAGEGIPLVRSGELRHAANRCGGSASTADPTTPQRQGWPERW